MTAEVRTTQQLPNTAVIPSPVRGVGIRILNNMNYYVYILANSTNVAIYTGVTRDLVRRVYEHRNHLDPKSYTAKYDIRKLVYFEHTTDVRVAIEREKQIKSWSRAKKNALVDSMNPEWKDLYPTILE